ncbi:hypothetical protein Mgra_00006487 [Meloidogyne graminicola]|uniref:28S ribosomal protein S2, mitochondrial n=1 Tax=Meloidogyne graminicola TaxID=189291 RepID=A0A8S9ZL36_9BILA|nr:hypothetical protein Mgra_00006487 [Meloidogyne graminicola]
MNFYIFQSRGIRQLISPQLAAKAYEPPDFYQPQNNSLISTNEDVPNAELLLSARVRPQSLRPYLDPVPTFQKDDPHNFVNLVTIEKLLTARVHFGHKIGTLNDNMKWAMFGERLGVCIFDLEITQRYMIKALNFLSALSYSDGKFLFLTTNKAAMLLVEETASDLGHFSHTRLWQQDIFVNRDKYVGGPVRFPDAMIFLNTHTSAMERHPAIIEAAKLCIPTIAIVDSNCVVGLDVKYLLKPNYITYPIPGNDDSINSIEFYMKIFSEAIKIGRKAKEEALSTILPEQRKIFRNKIEKNEEQKRQKIFNNFVQHNKQFRNIEREEKQVNSNLIPLGEKKERRK